MATPPDTTRSGPFWDAWEGRAPMPPAAASLGLEPVAVDPDRGTIELAFTAPEEWTNPAGNVLGAFVAAMLYDTIGPALLATVGPDQFQETLDLKVDFLRPLRPGRVIARGRILRRSGEVAVVEASLIGDDDEDIAIATSTARVIPMSDARTAV